VVVRIGDDIPVHQVMRANELAASRAAHLAGLSPPWCMHEPGILVLRFHVEGRTLAPRPCRDRAKLEAHRGVVRAATAISRKHLRGPALVFWVFHVVRDYATR
jgi:hypothetical protein